MTEFTKPNPIAYYPPLGPDDLKNGYGESRYRNHHIIVKNRAGESIYFVKDDKDYSDEADIPVQIVYVQLAGFYTMITRKKTDIPNPYVYHSQDGCNWVLGTYVSTDYETGGIRRRLSIPANRGGFVGMCVIYSELYLFTALGDIYLSRGFTSYSMLFHNDIFDENEYAQQVASLNNYIYIFTNKKIHTIDYPSGYRYKPMPRCSINGKHIELPYPSTNMKWMEPCIHDNKIIIAQTDAERSILCIDMKEGTARFIKKIIIGTNFDISEPFNRKIIYDDGTYYIFMNDGYYISSTDLKYWNEPDIVEKDESPILSYHNIVAKENILFDSLDVGDLFICDGDLYIKIKLADNDTLGVSLDNGSLHTFPKYDDQGYQHLLRHVIQLTLNKENENAN